MSKCLNLLVLAIAEIDHVMDGNDQTCCLSCLTVCFSFVSNTKSVLWWMSCVCLTHLHTPNMLICQLLCFYTTLPDFFSCPVITKLLSLSIYCMAVYIMNSMEMIMRLQVHVISGLFMVFRLTIIVLSKMSWWLQNELNFKSCSTNFADSLTFLLWFQHLHSKNCYNVSTQKGGFGVAILF